MGKRGRKTLYFRVSGIAGFLTGFITEGLNLMALPANIGRIDALLNPWRPVIGAAFDGYRNHVLRMASYCLLLKPCDAIEQQKIEIAACFHDIGIWTAGTLDYLPPSAAVAREYLGANALEAWSDEIARMIVTHHKLRPATDEASALVELFRKGDLVDLSIGLMKFGLPAAVVNSVKAACPNAGFHRNLCRLELGWFLKHPLNPVPMMKW